MRHVRIRREVDSAADVRAGHVQLDAGQLGEGVQLFGQYDEFFSVVSGDVGDDRAVEACQIVDVFFDKRINAVVVQADRIEQPATGFNSAWRRISLTRQQRDSLRDDATELAEIDKRGRLLRISESPGCDEDGIAKFQAVQFNSQVGQRFSPVVILRHDAESFQNVCMVSRRDYAELRTVREPGRVLYRSRRDSVRKLSTMCVSGALSMCNVQKIELLTHTFQSGTLIALLLIPSSKFSPQTKHWFLTVPDLRVSHTRSDTKLNEFCKLLLAFGVFVDGELANAQLEFEGAPIHYATAPVSDPVAQLQQKLDRGDAALKWDEKHGWLPSVLYQLDISQSSQLLVFSKTSLQLRRIMPSRPRALYFNDETYIGWVQRGDVVEVSTVDPRQGAIFYTLKQQITDSPKFVRDRGQCLICHASSRTKGVPGHLVRSVYPSRDGQPHFGLGTITTDHATPFEKRFGGWYVTGTHGDMRHLGNAIADDNRKDPIDPEPGANLASLGRLFRTSPYLQQTSDLVAMMVLEHQAQMHNLITRASFETRRAKHHDAVMNAALKRPADYSSESTGRRIASAAEKLVEYLLFKDEFRLTSPVAGVSGFADEFSAKGPRDSKGRSLREFDLQTQLFRYPCSFLIYSEVFDTLPEPMLDAVYSRLFAVLNRPVNPNGEEDVFSHLSVADRTAIREILAETKPEFRERLTAFSKRLH